MTTKTSRPPNGRVNLYDPERLIILGIDDAGEEVLAAWRREHPSEDHPLLDKDLARLRRLDQDMIANMEVFGVILPVTVRSMNGVVVVAVGRRRVLHMREANRHRVAQGLEPLLVRAVGRAGSLGLEDKLIALSENAYREGLGAMGQAREIASLMARNVPNKTIMVALKMSDQTLINRTALLELGPETQAAVEAGDIGPMAALELRALDAEAQAEVLAKLLAEGGPKRGMVARLRVLMAERIAAEVPCDVMADGYLSDLRQVERLNREPANDEETDDGDAHRERDRDEPRVHGGRPMVTEEGDQGVPPGRGADRRDGRARAIPVPALQAHIHGDAPEPLTDRETADDGDADADESADETVGHRSAAEVLQSKAPRPAELRRLIEHPQGRKLLSVEMMGAIRWVLGKAPPTRRMAAALEASKTPIPKKPLPTAKRGRRKTEQAKAAD